MHGLATALDLALQPLGWYRMCIPPLKINQLRGDVLVQHCGPDADPRWSDTHVHSMYSDIHEMKYSVMQAEGLECVYCSLRNGHDVSVPPPPSPARLALAGELNPSAPLLVPTSSLDSLTPPNPLHPHPPSDYPSSSRTQT
jgi:hypothetical protein